MGGIHSQPAVHTDTPAGNADQALRGFAANVRQRTRHVISTVAVDAANFHSLSFNSLREAADLLLGLNRDAFDNILKLKDEIAANPELARFVQDYLRNSIDTLRFFSALTHCLHKAREAELLLHDAVLLFDAGDPAAALDKLKEFKAEGDPFTERFLKEFSEVCEHQKLLFDELQRRKRELDKKIGTVNAWRKVWSIIYSAAFAAVLICSVVLAAVAAPPAATAAAAAAAGAMAPLQRWFDSMWDNLQKSYDEKKEVIASITRGAFFAIHELDSVRVLVERLEIQIGGLMKDADFGAEEKEEASAAVRVAIEEIRRKAGTFGRSVEEVEKEVERCATDLRKATATVLKAVSGEG